MESIFIPKKKMNVATRKLRNIYYEIQPDRPIAGGIYRFTQGKDCNALLGQLYDQRFGVWCHHALDQLLYNGVRIIRKEYRLRCLYPLSILKRIIAMFFSINGERFAGCHPELSAFVRERDNQVIPDKYRLFAALNVNDLVSHIPYQQRTIATTSRFSCFSQIAHPPFVYLLTFNSESPDSRLTDLTSFSNYRYHDKANIEATFRVVPTNSCFAGDYRSSGKLIQDNVAVFSTEIEPSYFRIVDPVI